MKTCKTHLDHDVTSNKECCFLASAHSYAATWSAPIHFIYMIITNPFIKLYIYIYIGRSRYVYNIYLKYQKIHFRREQKYQNFMCMCCLQAQHKPAVLLLINTVDNIYFAHTLERNENVKNGVVTL